MPLVVELVIVGETVPLNVVVAPLRIVDAVFRVEVVAAVVRIYSGRKGSDGWLPGILQDSRSPG